MIWAIAYQQFENHVIQPQIQKRTVNVQPFITIVAVLFGATLLGVLGALVAIPVAASIQILLREYVDLRTLSIKPRAAAATAARAGSRVASPACRGLLSPAAGCFCWSRRSRSTCSRRRCSRSSAPSTSSTRSARSGSP